MKNIAAICLLSVILVGQSYENKFLPVNNSGVLTKIKKVNINHALLKARISFALIDRIDIQSEYIQVSFHSNSVDVCGFVPDIERAKAVETIISKIVDPIKVRAFWTIQYDLYDKKPYKTRITEQSKDAILKMRILTRLQKENMRKQSNQYIIKKLYVRYGNVKIYVITNTDSELSIKKKLSNIPGIASIKCVVVKSEL